MRILWHGIAPWQPTGYGQQAAVWCPRLKAAGHEVAISTQGGSSACGVQEWQGIPVFPSANEIAATGLVFQYYLQSYKPDLVIMLYDGWQMGAGAILRPYKTLAWLPVDVSTAVVGNQHVGGTGVLDLKWLRESGAIPVAMSQHGQRMLRQAGYDPPLIPHGINLGDWPVRSDEDRAATRAQLGAGPDTFLAGINGTNIDPHRKSFPEQMLAFARFHAKHPDSQLHVHSMIHLPGSLRLDAVAGRGCGLPNNVVKIANQGAMYTGSFPQEHLADWYNAMDVMLNCSKGEGFGLVAVEAQACGTPVINTDAHTGPELVGPGWLVGSQEFWNWTHESWWAAPSIPDMVESLEDAYERRYMADHLRRESREFAERFSADEVWPLWEKLLAEYE